MTVEEECSDGMTLGSYSRAREHTAKGSPDRSETPLRRVRRKTPFTLGRRRPPPVFHGRASKSRQLRCVPSASGSATESTNLQGRANRPAFFAAFPWGCRVFWMGASGINLLTGRTFPVIQLAVLALAIAFGIVVERPSPPVPASAQELDKASVLLRWWDAEDRGDVDGSVAQFAINAVYISSTVAGICTMQTPCIDLDGIRRQIARNVSLNFCTKIRWVLVSGSVVTGEREITSDFDYSIGIERVVQSFIAVVQDGQITFTAGVLNAGDPDTAYAIRQANGTEASRPALTIPRPQCAPLL
jgi:hypothetical protein